MPRLLFGVLGLVLIQPGSALITSPKKVEDVLEYHKAQEKGAPSASLLAPKKETPKKSDGPPRPPGYRNAWDDCGGAGASETERMRQIAAGIKGFAKPTRFRRNAAQDCGGVKQHRALVIGGAYKTESEAEKRERQMMAAAEAVATRALFAALKKKEKKESFEKFLPRCLDHTAQLVATVDKSYTDMQLEANLLHQCEMEKEFPSVYEDGFGSKKTCEEFAKKLAAARMEELETGNTEGYEEFCTDFYAHVYPEAKKKAAPKKSAAARSHGASLAAVLLGAILGGGVALAF